MTVWKAGMLAVCVEARAVRDDVPMTLKLHQVYTVEMVVNGDCPIFGTGVGLHLIGLRSETSLGWLSERFRPLSDAKDDAELIARIKACKPAKQPAPVLAPNRHERVGYHTGSTS